MVTWGKCTPPDRLGQIPAGRSGVPRLPRDTAGAHQIRRVGRIRTEAAEDSSLRRPLAAARAAARSAGSSECTSSGSPVTGCGKAQLGGVQELALEAELRAVAVDRVADHGRPDRRQVHADLVRAPGSNGHPQQRPPGQRLDQLEVGHGVARTSVSSDIRVGVAAVAPDRRLDPSAARRAGGRARAPGRCGRSGGGEAAPAGVPCVARRGRRAAAPTCRGPAGGRCPGASSSPPPPRPRQRVDQRRAGRSRHRRAPACPPGLSTHHQYASA